MEAPEAPHLGGESIQSLSLPSLHYTRFTMRFLPSVMVSFLTTLACSFALLLDAAQPSEMLLMECLPAQNLQAPEVTYTEHDSAEKTPVFTRGEQGLLQAKSRVGWSFRQARFVPDCDGDGVADLALATERSGGCIYAPQGELDFVSGATLTPIGTYSGPFGFRLEVSSEGDLLMLQSSSPGRQVAVMLDATPSELRWRDAWSEEPSFVGDLDGDGFVDVRFGHPWEDCTVDGEDQWLGVVRVVSGRDGRELWRTHGRQTDEDFSLGMTPVRDRNGDGFPEFAVFEETKLTILSGLDGALLTEMSFPPGEEVWRVETLDDLDGDGDEEYFFRIKSSRGIVHNVVYSSETWKPLDVAEGWQVLCVTKGGDLDGDGLADALLARMNPETGEVRVSRYSRAGLVDLQTIHYTEPAWPNSWKIQVGRSQDGAPWSVLLVIGPPSYFDSSGTVLIVPGS